MKKLLIVCLVLMLAGCYERPKNPAAIATSNPAYPVVKLFTVEGRTVYRFEDHGRYVYFTNTGGTRSVHSEGCGKTCANSPDTTTLQMDQQDTKE